MERRFQLGSGAGAASERHTSQRRKFRMESEMRLIDVALNDVRTIWPCSAVLSTQHEMNPFQKKEKTPPGIKNEMSLLAQMTTIGARHRIARNC